MKKHPTEQCKARQLDLFVDDRSLFEKFCDLHNRQAGGKEEKKNGGGPGVDGVTLKSTHPVLAKSWLSRRRISKAGVTN